MRGGVSVYSSVNSGTMICIFFCIVAIPLLFSIFFVNRSSRVYLRFMIIGMTCCLCSALINNLVFTAAGEDLVYSITTFSPMLEEVIKALPVFFYAYFFFESREKLIGAAFCNGIGFAILENSITLVTSGDVDIVWGLLRGFSTSLMHGMTTALVGLGISLIHKKKKLFLTGTFSFLTLSIVYHGSYNFFVSSDLRPVAIGFPILTCIILLFAMNRESIKTFLGLKKKDDTKSTDGV